VVLLSAVALQRIGFGLLLIVAFSAGLAAVLIAIGMLMVYARQFMARFQGEGQWTTRWLPIASSAFITLAGIALTWQALQSSGL
jgi:ABC-type nickel/cobalt efflux system permease component RcnA